MNAIIPKAPRAGDRLSATQMSQVVAAIRRYMPIAGTGIRVSHTMGGSVISAKPSKGGGGASAASKTLPFTCGLYTEEGSGSESPTYKYAFFLPWGCLRLDGYVAEADYNYGSCFQSESTPLEGSAWWIFDSTLTIDTTTDCNTTIWCVIDDAMMGSQSRFGAFMISDADMTNSAYAQYGIERMFPVCHIVQDVDSEGNVSHSIQQYAHGNIVLDNEDVVAPFMCRYSRVTEWKNGNQNSAGWAFYLPDGCSLHYKGVDVPFSDCDYSFDSEQGFGSAWKMWNSINPSNSDVIYCNIFASSSEGIYYAMLSTSEYSGASDFESSFPVAQIVIDSSYDGIGYKAFQCAFGFMDLAEGGDKDLGAFRYEMSDGSAYLTNCYYRKEQMIHTMSDVAVSSSWADNFVWLVLGSGGEPTMSYGDLGTMMSDISLDYQSVIPLYQFDSACKISFDLRSVPTAQEWMSETIL